MIILQVCLSVIGNPELFLYPRPWLMSALVMRPSYPRAPLFQPPPQLPEPLHIYGTVLEPDPRGPSHVAALPCPHL